MAATRSALESQTNGSAARAVALWRLGHRWVLALAIIALGTVSLLLNDLDGRVRRVVGDVVAVERGLSSRGAERRETIELQAEVARERLVAVLPLLSRLTAAFGLVTLVLSAIVAVRRELPKAVRAALVAFALYCAIWIFVAVHH